MKRASCKLRTPTSKAQIGTKRVRRSPRPLWSRCLTLHHVGQCHVSREPLEKRRSTVALQNASAYGMLATTATFWSAALLCRFWIARRDFHAKSLKNRSPFPRIVVQADRSALNRRFASSLGMRVFLPSRCSAASVAVLSWITSFGTTPADICWPTMKFISSGPGSMISCIRRPAPFFSRERACLGSVD